MSDKNQDDLSDLLSCPQCGSEDVKKCQISVRPYCNECKYWSPINHLGTMQDAVFKWNNHPNRAIATKKEQ